MVWNLNKNNTSEGVNDTGAIDGDDMNLRRIVSEKGFREMSFSCRDDSLDQDYTICTKRITRNVDGIVKTEESIEKFKKNMSFKNKTKTMT